MTSVGAESFTAVRESEERLRRALSVGAVGVVFYTLDGRILDANDAFQRLSGYTLDELRAAPPWERLIPAAHRALTMRAAVELATEGTAAPYETELTRKDGARRWGLFTPTRLSGSGPRAECVAYVLDITERKQIEAALRASEERYRSLFESIDEGYALCTLIVDANGQPTDIRFLEVNRAFGRMTGVVHAAGKTARELAPSVEAHWFEAAKRVVESGDPERIEAPAAAIGRWLDLHISRVSAAGGHTFAVVFQDITERKRHEEEVERRVRERTRELACANASLERAAAERSVLRRQLTSAEEQERRRIARELHDQLGQHLTALALGLAETRRLLDRGEAGAAARLGQLETLAQLLTRDARELALELRPPELDDVGFESALQTYVGQWATRYRVGGEVAITGLASGAPLPTEVSTALYRIAQEALTNVAKHAGASQVSVVIDKPDRAVRLIVDDNGRGFDADEAAHRVRAERRLGLAGMRERAALVGGTLDVESSPGRGTTVYVRVPLGERS